jgi:hypothetical protein
VCGFRGVNDFVGGVPGFDLPTPGLFIRVFDPSFAVIDRHVFLEGLSGKSKTYRASEWQSHYLRTALLV